MIMRAGILLTAVVLLVGCTSVVTVEGSLPTPKVHQLPAHVGVYFPDSFREYVHAEKVPDQGGSWRISIGEQNVRFFERLLPAMFESVKPVPEPPLEPSVMSGLDGVIVPRITKYGFLIPASSGLNFYSASIHYEITILDANGEKVGAWTIVGYGKSEAATFGHEQAVKEATLLAIRDGGARLAIELVDRPQVAAWLGLGEKDAE